MSGKSQEMTPEVAFAYGSFAASAVARLTRALHEAGKIDDYTLGELAAVAQECSILAPDNPQVAKAMDIVQAQMGLLSPASQIQQDAAAALDEAEGRDEAGDAAR